MKEPVAGCKNLTESRLRETRCESRENGFCEVPCGERTAVKSM
ncbi:MAG: hypothetical protein ACI4SU_03140 [Anaerovoracaceae bacterium]